MFGLTPQEMEKAASAVPKKRGRWLRRILAVLEIAVLLTIVSLTILTWLLLTPSGLAIVLERVGRDAESTIAIGDVALHPAMELQDPATWRLVLVDIDIESDVPNRPTVHFDRLVMTPPDIQRFWYRQEFYVHEVWVMGLEIQAKNQRPGSKQTNPSRWLEEIRADHVHIWDGNYAAPADAPLPKAGVIGIYGDIRNFSYNPFERMLEGEGQLLAREFYSGDVRLNHMKIGDIRSHESDIQIADGTVFWENQKVLLKGTITDIDKRARVHLTGSIERARVETLVQTATQERSPIFGNCSVTLEVHSGGEIPRGEGYTEAHVRLTNAILPLPKNTRGIYKDIIRLLPVATLDDDNRVHLENMVGTLTLQRGVVTLHQLKYDARFPIFVRGVIDSKTLNLWVRIVPRGDPAIRPGYGLHLSGAHSDPKVERATRDQLLPNWREKRPRVGSREAKTNRPKQRGRGLWGSKNRQ